MNKNSISSIKFRDIKVAVLGKSFVGKSALTFRYYDNKFPAYYQSTIEDQYKKQVNIYDKDFLLGKNILI